MSGKFIVRALRAHFMAESALKTLLIESAKENGISSFAVANAHTCTSLGYFTELIASKGMIGLGFTNASSVVAPPGGSAGRTESALERCR